MTPGAGWAASAALAVTLLSGCVSGGPDETAETPAPITTPDDLGTSDGLLPPADEDRGAEGCDAATRAAVDAVVGGQLAAFAADDYERALEFSSQGFREQFDADRLRAVITQGFPAAAAATGHTLGRCDRPAAEVVHALVRVEAADDERADLVYLLVLESGRWRIAGARLSGSDADEGDAVVA